MFGYATAETESRLPFGFDLANKIIKIIENDVADKNVLIGDAKCQVTVDLDNPGTVEEVLVSVCHRDTYNLEEIRAYVRALLDGVVEPKKWTINPAGTWNVGGATSDCGLTGRKIVCDQYGGYCAVGGGAFSGKDPSKVDRSATYMARKIAVDLVEKYQLKWCEVQLAYAIGVAEPVSVNIKNDLGEDYASYVRATYDLTPKGIIKALDLLNVNYEKLAEGCHFYN
jgi:S-adenosylmethionine synthetase